MVEIKDKNTDGERKGGGEGTSFPENKVIVVAKREYSFNSMV